MDHKNHLKLVHFPSLFVCLPAGHPRGPHQGEEAGVGSPATAVQKLFRPWAHAPKMGFITHRILRNDLKDFSSIYKT